MAARAQRLIAATIVALLCAAGSVLESRVRQTPPARGQGAPQRIVSLVPALTEMLFAVGAGPQVIGVSSFDAYPPEVKSLPHVGALLDPDTERILSLRPDLVIVYGSQSEVQSQFERAGIKTFSYRHGGLDRVLETISALGGVTGHAREADRVVEEMRGKLATIRERVRGRPRPRTLLVIDRQPQTLRSVYASGGTGFLNDVLDIAGGTNVFADVNRESVQPSQETLLMRAPDVIIEVRAEGLLDPSSVRGERSVWSALASMPAVRSGRVYFLTGQHLVIPGPRLAQGADAIAHAIHPEAFR